MKTIFLNKSSLDTLRIMTNILDLVENTSANPSKVEFETSVWSMTISASGKAVVKAEQDVISKMWEIKAHEEIAAIVKPGAAFGATLSF